MSATVSRSRSVEPVVSRRAVLWAAMLLAFTLIAAALGHRAPRPALGDVIQKERLLAFEDRRDGAVLVFEARGTERRLIDVVTGQSGFFRGVLRGFAAKRHAAGIGEAPPLRLAQMATGHLWLEDPSTGQSALLDGFGPDNANVFRRYLPAASPSANESGMRAGARQEFSRSH